MGCVHFKPETEGEIDSFVITKYAFLAPSLFRLPFTVCLHVCFDLIVSFFYHFFSILKKSGHTLQIVKRSGLVRTLSTLSGIKKVMMALKVGLLFPLQFVFSSLSRGRRISFYGRPSKLFYRCTSGTFQKSKSAGPTGCYCYEDVQFLCQEENIELAKSMKRYFAPEEYFCQTLLYNSETQRKNFLDENICATNYDIQNTDDVLCYLKKETFRDSLLYNMPTNYCFEHICFLRKVSEKQTWQSMEAVLKEQGVSVTEKK